MKNVVVTVIVGFITGLIISGILFDIIKYVGKSFNRVYVAWNISKAEKFYSNERFNLMFEEEKEDSKRLKRGM